LERTLEEDLNGVLLIVADNGRGLPATAASSGGIGLHSMAARAAAIGALFSIDSPPGGGTSVTVHVGQAAPAAASEAEAPVPPAIQTETAGQTPATATAELPERQTS